MSLPTTCPHCGMSLTPAPGPGRSPDDPEAPGHDDVGTPSSEDPSSIEGQGVEPLPADRDATGPHPGPMTFSRPDDDHGDSEVEIEASPMLLGIDLGAPAAPAPPSPSDRPGESPSIPDEAKADAGDEGDGDEPGARRSAWPRALLASYASAMTLACGWLWWTGHQGRPAGPAPRWAAGLAASEPIDRAGAADPGHRADASASVEAPEPIAEDRRVPIGESLRVDALEVTPLAVSAGAVELERTRVDGHAERRDGGDDALRLRLLLRNASDDAIFAPLDEAFVREPDRQLPETFVQDASGSRVYAFRLPVASEWGIAGQDFQTLRPGESAETVVVSDADAADRLDGPLTWRLRLRTAPESTAVVGVTFEASEIRKSP